MTLSEVHLDAVCVGIQRATDIRFGFDLQILEK
jgi:hypothetical protein